MHTESYLCSADQIQIVDLCTYLLRKATQAGIATSALLCQPYNG